MNTPWKSDAELFAVANKLSHITSRCRMRWARGVMP
jgi:hypothetical protein